MNSAPKEKLKREFKVISVTRLWIGVATFQPSHVRDQKILDPIDRVPISYSLKRIHQSI